MQPARDCSSREERDSYTVINFLETFCPEDGDVSSSGFLITGMCGTLTRKGDN